LITTGRPFTGPPDFPYVDGPLLARCFAVL
jgi:hypothetical protein